VLGINTAIVICITRLENAILQVQARFVAEAHSASSCKTFSSRVIHKIFSADNSFKAKYYLFIEADSRSPFMRNFLVSRNHINNYY
jgi:hypothetical protein